MRALSSQIREPSSQHALSMTHNDLKCTKNHSLLLRLFACISLRIPWVDRVQGLEAHLHVTLNDSLFDQKNKTADGGWARRLYSELCQYSHSRPNYTNAGLWNS